MGRIFLESSVLGQLDDDCPVNNADGAVRRVAGHGGHFRVIPEGCRVSLGGGEAAPEADEFLPGVAVEKGFVAEKRGQRVTVKAGDGLEGFNIGAIADIGNGKLRGVLVRAIQSLGNFCAVVSL